MTDVQLTIASGAARKRVRLSSYLDGAAAERARGDANRWIKALRHLEVEGLPLRRRFTYRGDSLWWFTELYLHKQQVIAALLRTIAAVDSLVGLEAPRGVEIGHADAVSRFVLAKAAAAHGFALTGADAVPVDWTLRLAKLKARARWLHVTALASRLRDRRAVRPGHTGIAAFVHRAFWRERSTDGSDEAYIGPVLEAVTRRAGERPAFVSLGPAENFAARRWWHPLAATGSHYSGTAIESFAALEALAGSRAVWAERHANRRALAASAALRQAAVLHGYDCWPFVREELAGVALLQWPWSARAMDEAGAALDTLGPAAALTYAEAGGWGRALVLESRRRSVPIVGLQHGFIYRHWLNYLHELDEMLPDPGNPADRGFPRPDRTLLFDGYARHHLVTNGRFPESSLDVTGSPRLDALAAAARGCGPDAIEAARAAAGATGRRLLLVVTKYKEASANLGEFLDAAGGDPGVHVAIKTHPAETPAVYGGAVQGRGRVSVLPASAALAPLILVSDAIVTVNSTVAVDAAVLGRPALVLGLPNNLSPFVEAGVMAGAEAGAAAGALRQILYDQELRLQLDANRKAFLAAYQIEADGGAADRAADAILDLAGSRS